MQCEQQGCTNPATLRARVIPPGSDKTADGCDDHIVALMAAMGGSRWVLLSLEPEPVLLQQP